MKRESKVILNGLQYISDIFEKLQGFNHKIEHTTHNCF